MTNFVDTIIKVYYRVMWYAIVLSENTWMYSQQVVTTDLQNFPTHGKKNYIRP